MKIDSAEFVISAAAAGQFPHSVLPEVAFAGKSNVGKSSAINCLLQRKKLVKTSATPGKTQMVNFFLINRAFHVADLPGYGFSKVPKSVPSKWARLVEGYVTGRGNLRGLVLVVDIRHPPTDLARQMQAWLLQLGRPYVVIANKADQVSANDMRRRLHDIAEGLDLPEPPLPFSAKTGAGRDEMWAKLTPWLEARP